MIVYLLLNKVNGKAYVGQHIGYTLTKRWNKNLNNMKVNSHFTAAIQKYGPASFSRKILCHASCQEELDLLERFWIAVYRSTEPKFGYNQQTGGRHWCGQYTPQLRQLMSERARKGWAKKSAKEKWEFSFATKIRWLMMTEKQRQRITTQIRQSDRRGRAPWNKGLTGKRVGAGRPSPKKGKTYGPQRNPCRHKKQLTEEHKKGISKALRRYNRQRRRQETGRKRPAATERGSQGARPNRLRA